MSETWVPVEGYESLYAISDHGRVKSLRNGRIMSPVLDGPGYPTVKLYRAGTGRRYFVHRLVAKAFVPNLCPVLHHEAAHLDGNPLNARADNIKWVSPAENAYHKRLHGTHQAGEKHPRARLTAADVLTIRMSSESGRALGRQLGVNESAIRKIRNGQRWRCVPKGAGPTAESGDAQTTGPSTPGSNP